MNLDAVRVRGPFHGPSGYDHVVREVVSALQHLGIAVQLIDEPEWGPSQLPPQARNPWFDSLDRDVGAKLTVHFTMPHQVIPDEGMHNVNYTMFEATRVPPTWIACNLRHDLVVVPTESSLRAWVESGLPTSKIRLCPLGINPAVFGATSTPWPMRTQHGDAVDCYRVRFLNVAELIPRKNHLGLLRTWLRATSRGDDAILVVKLTCPTYDWVAWQEHLRQLEFDVGKSFEEAAPVHFLLAVLPDAEMPRVYRAATHYISLSFGEGWDQPMVEAAASGLRLIAPEHSAYRAYLDPTTAQLIPTREVAVVFPGDVLFRGANWWQPDEDAAADAIRAAIDGRDTPHASPRERIMREFTWDRVARRLMAILEEVVALPREPMLTADLSAPQSIDRRRMTMRTDT
jgi:glycosyltransferase involved in cell wall biosynthesis